MFLKTSDKTNLKWMKVIHLYKGFSRSVSTTGLYIKSSSKKVKPPKIEYKGFKRKTIKKGDIVRALIVKTSYLNYFVGSSLSKFSSNSTILIRKKNITRSKYFFGVASKNISKKKFVSLFNKSFRGIA